MRRLAVFLLGTGTALATAPGPGGWRFEELRRIPAAEARQGVAADATHLFAINNHAIGRYRKDTGKRTAGWDCPEGEPLMHLNAGVVHQGRLYCAHSNYPGVPHLSSVEIWDATTLAHVGSHSFGRTDGSLTWIDRREGRWLACFVHYGKKGGEPGKGPGWTRLVEFDDAWRETGRGWAFPADLVAHLGTRGYSVSGGALGPGGRLFVTGHDEPELLVLDFPAAGPVLRWQATVPVPVEGQAFGWDPQEPGVIYLLAREAREIIFGRVSFVAATTVVPPRVITEPVPHDSDDPAIWINHADPARSLILGTDKHATDGGLCVFNLAGNIIPEKTIRGLRRPNNVDVAYDFPLGGRRVDLAVLTERNAGRLRVFTVPALQPVDGGGLPVFDGDPERLPMGIALYPRPRDGALFAIISGRVGPAEGYLWQYRLEDDGHGVVRAVKVRAFGRFSGRKEIESVAVDRELGHVYYSDEQFGVRKYHADPAAPNAGEELAFFGTTGFAGDHEGISVFATGPGTGYVIVSNQDGDTFEVFTREGLSGRPHDHRRIGSLQLGTHASDGHEVTARTLSPVFPGGLLVAMSDDRTFRLYAWEDLAKALPAGR